jgi:Holliday junction DNA helicase RuvA
LAATLGSGPSDDRVDHVVGDVVSALLNLGYKQPEAEKAVKAARTAANGSVTLESLLKDALQQLGR